jgi:4-amino-4-deoxy-L-arabinose transferase-like glycosyltransferase
MLLQKKFKSKEVLLLSIILLLSLAFKLGTFSIVYSDDPSRIMRGIDAYQYDNSARALLETGRFAASPETSDEPETRRTPGYPLFIAAVYSVFGLRHFPVIAIQIFISILTIALTYAIARTLFKPSVALLSGIILSLDVSSFLESQQLLTETLFTFLLTIAVFAGVYLFLNKKNRLKWALALGIALALSVLVRPIGYYLVFPIVMGLFVYGIFIKWQWKEVLGIVMMVLIPWIVLIGGWHARNFIAADSYEFSTIRGEILFEYEAARIIARRDDTTREEAAAKLNASVANISDRSSNFYAQKGLSVIREYPLIFIQNKLYGVRKILAGSRADTLFIYLGMPTEGRGVGQDFLRLPVKEYIQKWPVDNTLQFAIGMLAMIFLYIISAAAMLSVWGIIRRKNKMLVIHLFTWGAILYLLILSSPTPRSRVPIMPLIAIYAAVGLHFSARYLSKRVGNSPPL